MVVQKLNVHKYINVYLSCIHFDTLLYILHNYSTIVHVTNIVSTPSEQKTSNPVHVVFQNLAPLRAAQLVVCFNKYRLSFLVGDYFVADQVNFVQNLDRNRRNHTLSLFVFLEH